MKNKISKSSSVCFPAMKFQQKSSFIFSSKKYSEFKSKNYKIGKF